MTARPRPYRARGGVRPWRPRPRQGAVRADFVDHVNALEFHGQEGIARSVALYRALFPDLRIDVVDQVSGRDQVVSRWTLQGTHRGRRVTLAGITISRFENGQIAEDWTVSDNLGLLRQIGLRRAVALGVRYVRRRVRGA